MQEVTIEELKSEKIWFLWSRSRTRDGKYTKVPFSTYGGATGTDDAHQNTWSTYPEATNAMKAKNASGIGMKIKKGYFLLDVDHRDMDDPLVATMLSRFDTYAETSPSGEGLHIIGMCDISKLPVTYDEEKNRYILSAEYKQKNSDIGVELYIGDITNRYGTFTGNAIKDIPIRDCTNAVITTLEKEMRKTAKVNTSDDETEKEVFDVVANLRKQKNADKFKLLYDNGDWKSCGFGSQSEADASLCAEIAFRTGDNPELIDAVFRTSALFRDKWERDDYRTATIAAGIEACHGSFHKSVMAHPEFIRFNEKGKPCVVVPLLAKYVRENLNYILVRDNGRQAVLKYVYEDGYYKYYDDNMLMGVIKKYIVDYDEELVRIGVLNETMKLINTDLEYVKQDDLNADESLICFRNGNLKVTANELQMVEHSPEALLTTQLPCDFTNTETPTPVFDAYLDTLTDGREDVKQLLLQFIGVCISNVKGWRMKKALFLVGDGDTGKSQLKSLVERLLGKGNFISIDLKEIEARFGTGAIYLMRLAGCSDIGFMTVVELKTFKKITGGDSLFAEFKGQQPFEFVYGGLLWFCMNKLPKFGGDDGKWVYDRIMVVDCPNVIPKEQQDKRLLDKMYEEREGIVYKAIKALQKVIENGYRFDEPDSVSEARAKYQRENNTIISFFDECMCERENGKITDGCTTGKVYKVYKAWCQDNNNGFAKTYKEFRETLALHLDSTFEDMVVKRSNGTFYKVYTLTPECKKDYQAAYGYEDIDFLA